MADQHSTPRTSVDHQFEPLIERMRPWMLGLALKFCRNKADAEDLVHATIARFLEVYAALETRPSDDVCEKLLITNLKHCFFDLCRRRKVEKRGVKDPTLERLTMSHEPEPKLPFESITDEDFAVAMQKLSPTLRATIKLRARGLGYREIASVQKTSTGVVGKRLSDARKKLFDLLAPILQFGEH